jgi:S-adenosylmethionine synthetase
MGRVACSSGHHWDSVSSREITTKTYVDVQRNRARHHRLRSYNDTYGFDANTCGVLNLIQSQSPGYFRWVDIGGAGDQGLMFGYACDDASNRCRCPRAGQ